jgi:uncharacterized protein
VKLAAQPLPPPVREFLAGHHVMTLATQGADGPWAAAVFYVEDDSGLLFLSSPRSRHAVHLAQDPRCAATIQDDQDDWTQIRGVQIEGHVAPLAGDAVRQARALYAQRFPVTGPLARVPAPLAEALARVHWYRLVPERLRFIDNGQGFGHREEFGPPR